MNQKKMNDIASIIGKQGQNVVAGTGYDLIQVWKSWYRGAVNDFHRFTLKGVNGKTINQEKLTFGLPKKIAEEWSSIIWNEKVTVKTNREDVNEVLDKVYENNSHRVEYGNLLEKAFGYAGYGATVEYLIKGETVIDYITGDYCLITQGKGTQSKGIVTINEIELEDNYLTHLTIHRFIHGKYIVEHQAYVSEKETELGKSNRNALLNIFDEDVLENMKLEVTDDNGEVIDIKYVVVYDTDIAMFQITRPNITNNYDTESKAGIPVTANSIDIYKALDNVFDAENNESIRNKTYTVFNSKATKQKVETDPSTGEVRYVQYVDENDTSFMSAPMGDNEDWVKRYKGEYSSESYLESIRAKVSWGAFKAGLGAKYWNTDGSTVYVNTENIISDNSDVWKNKTKHEVIIAKALRDQARAITFLEMSQGRLPQFDIDTLEITVHFDDSIIQDDEKLRQRDLDLVEKGFMPRYKYLMKWEDMTEEEAKAQILEATEEQKATTNSFLEDLIGSEQEEIANEPTSEE